MKSWELEALQTKEYAHCVLVLTLAFAACLILLQQCAAPAETPIQVQAVETVWYASAFVPACNHLTGNFVLTFTVESEVIVAQFPITVTSGISPTILAEVDLPKFETEIGTVWADGVFIGLCSGKLELAPRSIVGYGSDGKVQEKTANGWFVMELAPAEFRMFLPVVVR